MISKSYMEGSNMKRLVLASKDVHVIFKIGCDWEKDEEALFKQSLKDKRNQHIVYVDSFRQLVDWYPPAKMDLLYYLQKHPFSAVGALAKALHRPQPSVSRDLRTLRASRLVSLSRHGRTVRVQSHIASISIETEKPYPPSSPKTVALARTR